MDNISKIEDSKLNKMREIMDAHFELKRIQRRENIKVDLQIKLTIWFLFLLATVIPFLLADFQSQKDWLYFVMGLTAIQGGAIGISIGDYQNDMKRTEK